MGRGTLRVPFLALAALGAAVAGALAVALVAVGTGLTGPPGGLCLPAVTVGSAVGDGVNLDVGQLANARIIYAVGVGLALPQRAEIIALATAMQESSLRNLPFGGAGSLGLFQQRPGEGWGTTAQIMDPVTSARSFYERLIQVSGWQQLPVTVAAQDVQRSAFPGAYARWEPIATRLADSFAVGSASCVPAAGNVAPAVASVTLPRGYNLPAATPLVVALAIRFALAQLGTAYQFGGTCTDAHSQNMALHCDCSSLVQQAYLAGGITLPRTTFQQVYVGAPVYTLAALRAGDLIFTAGGDGTASNPGHVGMYIGDQLVIDAPQPGQSVELSPLTRWAPAIVAMRHIA